MAQPIPTTPDAQAPPIPAEGATAAPAPPPTFGGSIPDEYDRHLGPVLFDFSARDMAARVEEGLPTGDPGRVLEVACGTGISTEQLWRQLPEGTEIVATDLSPAMLDYALRCRGALPGVTFQQAPADALPFEDASFDALVCQFGIMFFDDKPAALAEFARVLRPGGLLAFSVWESHEKNPVVGLSHATIGSFFEADPPGFLKVPFSYHDIPAILDLLATAEFVSLDTWRVREIVTSHDAHSVARGFVMGNPCVDEIRARGTADPESILETLAGRIADRFGEDGSPRLALPLEEITFTARRR